MILKEKQYTYGAIYFVSFGFEYISKEIKKFIGNKNIITNIYRTQAYNSTMCGYWIVFTDFMLKDKSLPDSINLFYPNEYEQNDKIMLEYFQ